MKYIKTYNKFINEKVITQDVSFVRETIEKHKKQLHYAKEADFIIILNQAFRNRYIDFKYVNDKSPSGSLEKDGFIVGGECTIYGYISVFVDRRISIYFYEDGNVNNPNSEIYKRFEALINKLEETIHHELVHREQFIKVGSKKLENMYKDYTSKDTYKYLSNKHEMMAFASSVVMELLNKGYTTNEILKRLKNHEENIHRSYNIDKQKAEEEYDSDVLWAFYKNFYEKDKKIYNKFINYTVAYIQEMTNKE